MTSLLIVLLIYLGAGFILHANIYHRPTPGFRRGARTTNGLQFIFFLWGWPVIINSRHIRIQWEGLSHAPAGRERISRDLRPTSRILVMLIVLLLATAILVIT